MDATAHTVDNNHKFGVAKPIVNFENKVMKSISWRDHNVPSQERPIKTISQKKQSSRIYIQRIDSGLS